MKIKLLLFLFMTAVVCHLSGQEILKVLNPDSTAQYYEVRKLTNLTFNDSSASVLKVNKLDGSKSYFYLDKINYVAFSELTGNLEVPSNITIALDSTSVVIDWDPVSYASKYYVYRSTDPYSSFTEIGTTADNFYTDNNAITGTKYFYQVVARDW